MAETMFGRKQHTDTANAPPPVLRCSFCNKDQNDVRKLIAGPTVFICDDCVEICNEIIADDNRFEGTRVAEDGMAANVVPDAAAGRAVHGPGANLSSIPAVRCALCGMPILLSDGLLIQNRGVLCFGCIGEIEAAVAEKREPGL
jgi:hypothetical protein